MINSNTKAAATDLQEIERIDKMGEQELNRLPFGAIRLDREGLILSYNRAESKLTGRQPDQVIGRNFFSEVAPCTNVREFAGRYREGVALGNLHVIFPYRFDFEMDPRDVTVTLFYSAQTDSGWVFVRESAADQ